MNFDDGKDKFQAISHKNDYFNQVKDGRSFMEFFFEDLPATLNVIPTYRTYQRFYLGFHTHFFDPLLAFVPGGYDFTTNNDLGKAYWMSLYRGFNWKDM